MCEGGVGRLWFCDVGWCEEFGGFGVVVLFCVVVGVWDWRVYDWGSVCEDFGVGGGVVVSVVELWLEFSCWWILLNKFNENFVMDIFFFWSDVFFFLVWGFVYDIFLGVVFIYGGGIFCSVIGLLLIIVLVVVFVIVFVVFVVMFLLSREWKVLFIFFVLLFLFLVGGLEFLEY